MTALIHNWENAKWTNDESRADRVVVRYCKDRGVR